MTLVAKRSKPLQSIAWLHFFFFLRQTTWTTLLFLPAATFLVPVIFGASFGERDTEQAAWTMASHAGRFDGCNLHICITTVLLAAANAMLAERIATRPRPPFVN